MKRRIFSVILSIMMMFVMGCGSAKDASNHSDGSSESPASSELSKETAPETITTEFDSLATSESKESSDSAKTDSDVSFGSTDIADSAEAPDFIAPEAPAPDVLTTPDVTNNITAGLLTAGEWNDNNNWGFFTNLIINKQLSTPNYGMNPMNRIMVTIVSKEGTPVKNAKVELLSNTEEVIWEAVSNYNGVAYVFFNLLNANQVPELIKVSKNGNSTNAEIVLAPTINNQNSNSQSNNQTSNQSNDQASNQSNNQANNQTNQSNEPSINQNNPANYQIYEDVTVTIDDNSSTKSLDLMFVFDTTGSMGDELNYLQTEFDDISRKVADQNTRYSVNFYRDEGDEYVVKSNAFTYNTDTILDQLNLEIADGGGDYPEAVDQALYDGVFNHEWNAESVKLLFLILDAPPHSNNVQINDSLQKSITRAASQGIRIIPVASSGVDLETETFLRTTAILTGGTYTFLTDDSGIGDSHLEPTIGDYTVENLNDCIVRIINTYYQ